MSTLLLIACRNPAFVAAALAIASAVPILARGTFDVPWGEPAADTLTAAPRVDAAPPAVARASPHVFSGSSTKADFHRYSSIIERASRAYGVDSALVHAVILAESSYDPDAISPAGASGLMQLMPETARYYGVKDLFDPSQNIQGGVKCLRDLLQQFDGNVELAIAAYNAGASAVIRAGRRIPPHTETIAYVPKVIDYYHQFRAIKG